MIVSSPNVSPMKNQKQALEDLETLLPSLQDVATYEANFEMRLLKQMLSQIG